MQRRTSSRREDGGPQKPRRADPTHVPIAELEAALKINEDNLEGATLTQPEAFYRVAKQLAYAVSLRDAAYQNIKEVEASADQRVRQRVPADEKITEKEVEAQRRLDPKVKEAIYDHGQLAEQAAILQALKEAYTMRGYALKDLVQMRLSNFYGSRGIDGSGDAQAEFVRQQANEERRKYARRDR